MSKAPNTTPAVLPPATSSPERTSDEWVDDRELAKRTPISRAGWQRWRIQGKGPPYYVVGKRRLYKWSEVEAWFEAQRTMPKSTIGRRRALRKAS
jgi:hypothetical protein